MSKGSTFHVRINGGPEHILKTKTGLYSLAAVTAVAMFEHEPLPKEHEIIYGGFHGDPRPQHEPCVLVKIWSPSLVIKRWPGDHTYGPYYYGVTDSGQTVSIWPENLPEHLR